MRSCRQRYISTISGQFWIICGRFLLELPRWEPVIGLEVHAQILSKSKLFSGASTRFGGRTNSQVAFLDAALPGTLPVLNRRCVEAGVLTALALGCHINHVSQFDRKHYFYADLPAGYQITQQRLPLATGGEFTYLYQPHGPGSSECKTVRFVQLQLEQDSGKSLHDQLADSSLIDLNRAGVGLMEIVTQPDFRSAEEASGFVKELKKVLEAIGVCDGKMEEGSLRVDASISVHRPSEPFGTRVEVKNLNSVRFVAKAISYEISRQIKMLECGETIENETRNFDLNTGLTIPMRDKEKVHDYRFMPEPNLPPLHVYNDLTMPSCLNSTQIVNIDELRRQLPPLPSQIRAQLQENHGLSLEQADTIMHTDGFLELFEYLVEEKSLSPDAVVKVILYNLLGLLYKADISLEQSKITRPQVAEVTEMFQSEELSSANVKRVLSVMVSGVCDSIPKLIADKNWGTISDADLLAACQMVIRDNPKEVHKLSASEKKREKALNSLMGRVHKETNKRADSKRIHTLLLELCDSHK